jgi:hypothetical protein
MAGFLSSDGNLQLQMRLLATSWDPFQQDLEWFDYELFVEGGHQSEPPELPAAPAHRTAVRGKLNRSNFHQLVAALDDLIERSLPMRFESADLKFYLEWSREGSSVYLIICWMDLGLAPRTLEQRFPASHAGYRFLADLQSLRAFQRQLELEFTERRSAASSGKPQ